MDTHCLPTAHGFFHETFPEYPNSSTPCSMVDTILQAYLGFPGWGEKLKTMPAAKCSSERRKKKQKGGRREGGIKEEDFLMSATWAL